MRWPSAPLSDLTQKIGSGSTPRGGEAAYQARGVPLIRSQNVHFDGFRRDGLAFLSNEQARLLDGASVQEGDVLLNITGASIGRVTTAPAELHGARVNQHVCIIRPDSLRLDGRYLAYFLRAPAMQRLINDEQYGATRQALTKGMIEAFEVPVLPLDVQRRSVAKLDELLAQSRAAREQLEAVPALVEQYRQSVLAAAFRGDLTKEWREKNPDVEPASKLLERIRAERRRQWEAAELAKMKAKGKAPKDDKWKAKYEEPEPVDASELPELPPTWMWAPLGLLTTRITDGVHKKPNYVERGVPFVTVKNLTAGLGISFEDLNYVSERDHREFTARTKPEQGDILISKDGTLGVVRQIRTTKEFSIFVSVALLKVLDRRMSDFMEWALKSPQVQRQMVPTGTGLLHLHLQDLRRDCVPVAPLEEQSEVNRRLSSMGDAGFTALSEVSRAGLEAVRGLERSLLAKAFRGELDLDGTDAEVVRLQEASADVAATGRRGRRTA